MPRMFGLDAPNWVSVCVCYDQFFFFFYRQSFVPCPTRFQYLCRCFPSWPLENVEVTCLLTEIWSMFVSVSICSQLKPLKQTTSDGQLSICRSVLEFEQMWADQNYREKTWKKSQRSCFKKILQRFYLWAHQPNTFCSHL